MANFPSPPGPQALTSTAQQFLGAGGSPVMPGFQAGYVPSVSGQTRQSRIPSNLPATYTRHIMKFLVPEQPIVEMYVNPQRITYTDGKVISRRRTKSGYSLQYWGEEMTKIHIEGTTGTGGIEACNILFDCYRNEQLSLDPYALFLAAQQSQTGLGGLGSDIGSSLGGSVGGLIGSAIGGLMNSAMDAANPNPSRPAPSLAQLAFSVECYWCGRVYHGYFSSFNFSESVDRLGLFDYSIDFISTKNKGFRQNFMAWHRDPNFGPSNSDPNNGTPYSFSELV